MKKVDQVETVEPDKQYGNEGNEFLEFSFCLSYVLDGAQEVYNLQLPTGTDKKKAPIKAYFL